MKLFICLSKQIISATKMWQYNGFRRLTPVCLLTFGRICCSRGCPWGDLRGHLGYQGGFPQPAEVVTSRSNSDRTPGYRYLDDEAASKLSNLWLPWIHEDGSYSQVQNICKEKNVNKKIMWLLWNFSELPKKRNTLRDKGGGSLFLAHLIFQIRCAIAVES